jgi:hypothetical protein
MYLCVLSREGEILLHRNMPAGPDSFLKAIAPYRADLVVCVEWTLHLGLGWPTSVRAKAFLLFSATPFT